MVNTINSFFNEFLGKFPHHHRTLSLGSASEGGGHSKILLSVFDGTEATGDMYPVRALSNTKWISGLSSNESENQGDTLVYRDKTRKNGARTLRFTT